MSERITVVLEYKSAPPRIGPHTKDFGEFTVCSLQFNDALQELENLHQPDSSQIATLTQTVAELRAERGRLVTALGFADDWISKVPHGDNCHLHDTGEFAQCFCGKTNVRDELALACEPMYRASEVDAHLAALQAQHAEAELVIADLAMMLRRMIHRIRRTGSGTEIANAATDLLKRHGQQGSILRQGMP